MCICVYIRYNTVCILTYIYIICMCHIPNYSIYIYTLYYSYYDLWLYYIVLHLHCQKAFPLNVTSAFVVFPVFCRSRCRWPNHITTLQRWSTFSPRWLFAKKDVVNRMNSCSDFEIFPSSRCQKFWYFLFIVHASFESKYHFSNSESCYL